MGQRVGVYQFGDQELEPERFSPDRDWMPRVVLMAKSTLRLARPAGAPVPARDPAPRPGPRRGARPARALGIHGSVADRPVGAQPRLRSGSSSCAATPTRWRPPTRCLTIAIADDLGGEAAFERPARRAPGAAASGWPATWCPTTWASTRAGSSSTRTGSSRWTSRRIRRTPSAARTSPPTPRVGIWLEDHYYDNSDAAVVFKRARTAATGARPLRLPRQRRHEHAVERHGPARLPEPRGPRGRHPDDPRTSRGDSRSSASTRP